MKILFVHFFKPNEIIGGCESIFADLSRMFNANFISWQQAYKVLGLKSLAVGSNFDRLDYYKYAIIDRMLTISTYLSQYEEFFDVDLIITGDDCALFFDKLKTPYVALFNNPYADINRNLFPNYISNYDTFTEFGFFYPELQKIAGKYSISNVAVSKYMENYCQRFGINCDKIIEHGVDMKLFKPRNKEELREKYCVPKEKKVGLFVGSFHPNAGWHIVAELIKKFQDIYWIVVMKHPLQGTPYYKNVKIFSNLPREKLAEIYALSDFLITPSFIESFNLKAIEAASCNIPVIVSRAGYFSEVMAYGEGALTDYGIVVFPWVYKSYENAVKEIIAEKHEFKPREWVKKQKLDWDNWHKRWKDYLGWLEKEKLNK